MPPTKIFLIGFMKISQVTLVVAVGFVPPYPLASYAPAPRASMDTLAPI